MTRALFAAFILALVSLTATADDPKKPDYFPLAKGHKWEYVAEIGDMKVDYIITITAVKTDKEKGKVTATRVFTYLDSNSEEEVSVDATGVYGGIVSGVKGDRLVPLLKYPTKPRDTWTEKFQIRDMDVVALSTVKPIEKVKVPAGTFKAVPVDTGLYLGQEAIGITTWYADGTGMVKLKVAVGGNVVTMQLKKFTPGKGD